MPPALSEYGSSDDEFSNLAIATGFKNVKEVIPVAKANSDETSESYSSPRRSQNLEQTRKLKIEHATIERRKSKSRKQSNLLVGIDPNNIITISDDENDCMGSKDTPSASSTLASSYRTRGQRRGSPKSELCYDQKYHPMDDILQPSRAAKRRSRHDEHVLIHEDTADDSEHVESDNEDEDEHGSQCRRKRRKLLTPQSSAEGTRRSSRQVNRDVIYNASVHPQDHELNQLEVEDSEATDEGEMESPHSRRQMIESDDVGEENIGLQAEPEPESTHSSPLSSLPTSSRDQSHDDINDSYQRAVRDIIRLTREHSRQHDRGTSVPGETFEVYSEGLRAQLASEASAPAPTQFADYDQENDVVNPESESSPGHLDGFSVLPFNSSRHRAYENEEAEMTEAFMERLFSNDIENPSPASLRYNVVHTAQDDSISTTLHQTEVPTPERRFSQQPDGNSRQVSVSNERGIDGVVRARSEEIDAVLGPSQPSVTHHNSGIDSVLGA